jgi:hypothetical protein
MPSHSLAITPKSVEPLNMLCPAAAAQVIRTIKDDKRSFFIIIEVILDNQVLPLQI